MRRSWLLLVALTVCGLAFASCTPQTQVASTAIAAASVATEASTRAIAALEAAATQMATTQTAPTTLPTLPDPGVGKYVIVKTQNMTIIRTHDGQWVVMSAGYYYTHPH